MYHKSADQLSKELIVIPDPNLEETAQATKLIVQQFGPIESIDNFVKAHVALGKVIEKADREDTKGLSACLGVMAFIEQVMTKAIIGEDHITIIKIK